MDAESLTSHKLADLCDSIDYGYTASAVDAFVGPRFLRITDIVSGHINWHEVPSCEVTPADHKKYRLNDGDIVIARTGATTGVSAYIKEPPDALFASYLVRLKINTTKADSRYISYFLKSADFWEHMHGVLGDKSAQPNASAKTMTQAKLRLPPLPQQRAIASILGALDDKIELNRKMNETLEAMARAIFKSWFVDFDPIPGFGSHKEWQDSPLGRIPKGWRVAPIGDVVKVVGGSTPRTSGPSYWGGDIHFATPKDMAALTSPFLLDTERQITKAGLDCISSGLLPVGTVLLSSRAPIGYLAIAEIPVAVNQGFIAMVCDGELPNHYVLHWTKENMDVIKGKANGTTFLEISKSNFRPIPAVVPSRAILEQFVAIVGHLHRQIVTNLQESLTLAAIRDTLLPKMLSGKIRVKAAEKL